MRKFAITALCLTAALYICGERLHASDSPSIQTSIQLLAEKEAVLVAIDLSTASADYPLKISAPTGAAAKDDFGSVTVKKGDSFQLEISSAQVDLAAIKKEIQSNTLNKLKKFHIENDSVLLYETEVFGQSEFHFIAVVKAGDKSYGCQDTKGPKFSKADVELMLKCATTLKAK